MRKTKIIATIGPSSRDEATLEKLIETGMDVARLNFSHGTFAEHEEVIQTVRRLSEKHNRPVAILQDLGGIKLRLGVMDEPVRLYHGDEFTITSDERSGQPNVLPFPQPEVLKNIREGNLVFVSDGVVCLEVLENNGKEVKTRVRNGGILSSFKGVNLPGVSIDLPVLTEADKEALRFGVEQQVDWVAVSFVRTAEDVRYARAFLDSIGSTAPVMAKLERGEGIDNIDSILREVDGVMVARGDLGVEIPMARVPIVQKEIVRKANEAAKVSCIATQMLRSMVVSPTPTRAEVSDISNAVLDGCDSILLSDEIAVGEYPDEAVRVADITIRESEKIYPYHKDFGSEDRTGAIADGAGRLARTLNSIPIVVTSTGRAAFGISRTRPDKDILVFSHDAAVLRKVCMGWGLVPIGVIPPEPDIAKLVAMLIDESMVSGLVDESAVVTIVHGFMTGISGTTNTIQVLYVRDYLARSAELSLASVK
ncbi:MAG: pyruvate kinase [Dehalococcoidia bacterium]